MTILAMMQSAKESNAACIAAWEGKPPPPKPTKQRARGIGQHVGINIAKLRERLRDGFSQSEIAREFKCSASAISQAVRRHKIPFKDARFLNSRRKYAKCAAAGMTYAEAAAHLKCKENTVRDAASKYGLRFKLLRKRKVIK